MVIDPFKDEFNKKNKNGQTYAKCKDEECTRHIDQCQRFLMGRSFLILHFALVHIRLWQNALINLFFGLKSNYYYYYYILYDYPIYDRKFQFQSSFVF